MELRVFLDICGMNSIECGEDAARKMLEFAELLVAENKKYNLTSVTEPEALMLRHLVDSMTVLPYIKSGARVLDIGAGAGFPSVPVAIMRPDVEIVPLDATSKKVRFIEEAARMLGLDNVSPVCGRAETLAHEDAYRAHFDAVTARAVSRMRILCELGGAFLKRGGVLVAMKGEAAQTRDEIAEAADTAKLMGLACAVTHEMTLTSPTETLSRVIVTMEKAADTPPQYPRAYNKIIK